MVAVGWLVQISQTLILSREFRLTVLDVLVRVHQTPAVVQDPEWVSICQALQFLNRAKEVGSQPGREETWGGELAYQQ